MGILKDTAVCEICNALFPKRSGKNQSNRFCRRKCYAIHHANEAHIVRPCLACGKALRVRPCEEKKHAKHYCNMACRRHGAEPGSRHCKQCNTYFTPIQIRRRGVRCWVVINRTRILCSKQCVSLFCQTNEARKQKISKAFEGKPHPCATGGGSPHQKSYRGSSWKRIAEKVRKRQRYRCAVCNIHQDELRWKLDVNHIERYHNFTDQGQANRLGNLIALCRPCHRKQEQQVNVQISFPWSAGPQGPMAGEQHYAARFSNSEVRLMRALKKEGLTYKTIGMRFGITQEHTWGIVNCKSYKHV